jgi:hypothetical protein
MATPKYVALLNKNLCECLTQFKEGLNEEPNARYYFTKLEDFPKVRQSKHTIIADVEIPKDAVVIESSNRYLIRANKVIISNIRTLG